MIDENGVGRIGLPGLEYCCGIARTWVFFMFGVHLIGMNDDWNMMDALCISEI